MLIVTLTITFFNEVVFTLIENEATHHSSCKQTKTPAEASIYFKFGLNIEHEVY